MGIFRTARRLESRIATGLDQAVKVFSRSRTRSPLEIVHGILDAVEQQIEPTGRGARVFPFNRLELSVVASSPEARGRLEALFAGETPLRTRILDRLQSARCSPANVVVEIRYVDHPEADWRAPEFELKFARVAEAVVDGEALEPQPGQIEIRALHGAMERWSYSFAAPRIDVGRGVEVRDHRNRLLRTNHVVFTEGGGDVNQTVSRTHGHIAYEPLSGHFRLHDDGSEHGTAVVRDGRTISVLRGARGVRLQSDDEVLLGEARVRIRLRTGS
jgi:hypothetical protein